MKCEHGRPQSICAEAQEPDNVRCARALGWFDIHNFFGVWKGCSPPPDPPSNFGFQVPVSGSIPDWANCPAFTVRMMEANEISVFWGEFTKNWTAHSPHSRSPVYVEDCDSVGGSVVAWVIAAAEAGVEVKR